MPLALQRPAGSRKPGGAVKREAGVSLCKDFVLCFGRNMGSGRNTYRHNPSESSGMIDQNLPFGGVSAVLAKRSESFKRKLNTWDLTFYLQTIRKKTTKTAAYSPHICARCTTCADVYLFTVFLLELTEKCKYICNRTCPMKPVTAVRSERFIPTNSKPH